MTTSNKIKINEFNVDKVSFKVKEDSKTKRKVVFVNHNNQSIKLQTPKMFLPSGIKHWPADVYKESFNWKMSFGEDKENEVNNEKIKEFHGKMVALDDRIKREIQQDTKTWLGKPKASMEVIEEFYKNIVEPSKDKDGYQTQYPDSMKVSLERETSGPDVYTGFFSSSKKDRTRVMFFDANNNEIDVNESNCEQQIGKGTKGVAIIELVNISIVNGKVYPKWKLVQAKVYRTHTSVTEKIIDDDDDGDVVQDLDSENDEVEDVVQDDVVEEVDEVVQDVVDDVDEVIEEPVRQTKKTAKSKK
jgi:hypothetical protein